MNCFHFSVSLGYKTTGAHLFRHNWVLWIAFIFQYLWDTKQHCKKKLLWKISCELLSFFSIFGIQNNAKAVLAWQAIVVNCFHFSVSLGYKTTGKINNITPIELWIAFIFQYLWDTKQLDLENSFASIGCELLSFFSIFGIQNNRLTSFGLHIKVVNCFHFSVSLGYKTTIDSDNTLKNSVVNCFHFSVSLGYKTT